MKQSTAQMNKQTLIDDYKQTIERLQKECTEKTDFNIKLMERVKKLEQKLNAQFAEMEEKLTAEELKNYELKEKLKIAEDLIYENSELYKNIKGKEQECEELKRKVELMMDCPDCKVDEYKEALEGIEKVINNILNSCLGRNTVSCRPAHNVCGDLINILDIINKVKGENNG